MPDRCWSAAESDRYCGGSETEDRGDRNARIGRGDISW
jgi:hypothetical protein